MSKWAKHIKFMNDLVQRWEWTEAERAALFRTQPVQFYATEVVQPLAKSTPAEFFEQHPEWAQQIEQAMKMVEAEEAQKQADLERVTTLEAKVTALISEIEQLKAAPPAAGE